MQKNFWLFHYKVGVSELFGHSASFGHSGIPNVIMKFILAKKLEMSQRYRADGTVVGVTLLTAGPCVVTQVKSVEHDGYNSVQIGFDKKRQVTKSIVGHTKELGNFRYLREFRVDDATMFPRGTEITVAAFAPGDAISIVGTSKGRGFQGVVKRHHFHGHPASHGHKDQLRMPGSIGSKRQGPVQKGKRMAGRMGTDRVNVKNLEVIEIDVEKNIMAVKGAVPGARGALVLVRAN